MLTPNLAASRIRFARSRPRLLAAAAALPPVRFKAFSRTVFFVSIDSSSEVGVLRLEREFRAYMFSPYLLTVL